MKINHYKPLAFNYLNFNLKIFVFSIILFCCLVIIGTLSHEFGHILIAKYLGYDTYLHFGSMSWFKNGIDGNLLAPKKEILLVTLGGVLQTIFTGSIGFAILYFSKTRFTFWLGISMCLFWSREIINLAISSANGFLFNKAYFGGDELIISKILNLPNGFTSILLAIFGFGFCIYALYRINIQDRLSFVFGGSLGGIISYILWFGYIGKILLP